MGGRGGLCQQGRRKPAQAAQGAPDAAERVRGWAVSSSRAAVATGQNPTYYCAPGLQRKAGALQ